ncbi:MAG TPA: GGDEF domain-containing phosphodiesterase [Devosiaceae bacterium]
MAKVRVRPSRIGSDVASDPYNAGDRVSHIQDAFDMIGRFDHVTRLPNRTEFMARFDELCRNASILVLVTLADARHFNEILRALGHAFSEDFVRAGCRILQSLLPPDCPVFHVSVMSFAFLWREDEGAEIPSIVETICAALSPSIICNAIPVNTQVGIGIVPIDRPEPPPELLRAALTAAQDARRRGSGWAFYDHRSDAAHQRAFRLLADLPVALAARDQLSLHYQPKIDLKSGQVAGVEALLRWTHPDLGPVSPAEFVPLAEQTALIGPLTDWVIRHALAQLNRWRGSGNPIRLAINASPINLCQPGFAERLLDLCRIEDIPPGEIELEFTEGTLMTDAQRTRAALAHIRAEGMQVAIDDFGNGHSNLAYLSALPADVLKIDQMFIRPLGTAGGNPFLVRQIMGIAKGLGLKAVAEGIERREAVEELSALGCELGQGYYFAPPMAERDLTAWLARRT